MSEKPDDDFEEEDDDDVVDGDGDDDEDLALDAIIRDLDSTKKRRPPRGANEPAWRKLERFLEERRTAGLLTDFDDYDVGDGEPRPKKERKGGARGREH